MRRREFVSLLGGVVAAWPRGVMAQSAAKRSLVGVLVAEGFEDRLEALRAGLRDLGYVEGKNIVIEYRWARGSNDRLPVLAAELIRLKPDALMTFGTPATLAAKQATTTIPIVMASVADPVVSGIVASVAHPGRNITGLSIHGLELYGKRLELLKDALPQIRHVAFLFNPANPFYNSALKGLEIVARSLIVEVRPHEVRAPNEFENAFVTMVERRVDAAVVSEDGMIYANNRTIAVLAEKHRLPTIGGYGYAEAGGLLGYWVDRLEEIRRMTVFVDKILKGAEPGDLPIEQAAKFQFTVNLKSARALGLTIPPSIMVRADKMIE